MRRAVIITGVIGIGCVLIGALFFYVRASSTVPPRVEASLQYTSGEVAAPSVQPTPIPVAKHILTPEPVHAIYMTGWVAGLKDWRSDLISFVENSNLNAMVIDVKDFSGRISFKTDDPDIHALGAEEDRIPDIKGLINELHQKNIYVIARISTFQDPYFATKHAEAAIHRKNGSLWADKKGIRWLDPSSHEVWNYVVRIGKAAERVGFDELNYDYVRFPSDGDLSAMVFSEYDGKRPKSDVLEDFFTYLHDNLQVTHIPISVDLFGLTTERTDDMGIGQILEKAARHVDYVAPMTYPSHYPPGYRGLEDPNNHPYEILKGALDVAVKRMVAASTSPNKIRPWIQDFDLGVHYTVDMIKEEIRGVNDAGLTSWMVWDPKNKYTRAAYTK